MKLAERVRELEQRLGELEGHPALSAPAVVRSRSEAARVAGKRSAEVRREKNGSAQPKPRPISERPAAQPAPNAEAIDLARTCRTLLDDPRLVYSLTPAVLAAVQRVTVAWSAPFGIGAVRLGTSPAQDADLRAMLEALAAGYSVEQLEEAGDAGMNDAAIIAEDSPGPSSFTAEVLARLLGAPRKY
jgi:hypothetical protein